MNNIARTLCVALALPLFSCQAHIPVNGPQFALSDSAGKPVSGTLTDARCYFNANAIGGDHQYCAYLSARANLPLLFIDSEGHYSLVVNRPADFAEYVAKRVNVVGAFTENKKFLRITKVESLEPQIAARCVAAGAL